MWLETLKDSILTISVAFGAFVAFRGLQTWRKQLKGNAEYEQARRLLRSVYAYRNAIEVVRNPFTPSSEYGPGRPQNPEENRNAIVKVYENRWKSITGASTELEVELIGAEVLWGSEVANLVKQLYHFRGLLYAAINAHLRDLKRPNKNSQEELKIEGMLPAEILYSLYDPEKDPFLRKMNALFNQIEDKLKQYLK